MPPPVNTNFTCKGRDMGFYADIETSCRVYHTCDDHGNKFTYYCPAETAFRQEALVCDHAHLVDCLKGKRVSQVDDINARSREKYKKEYDNISRVTGISLNDDSLFRESGNIVKQISTAFRPGNYNSTYTRSFRITPEPSSQLFSPRPPIRQQSTFVLSSSVFLRDKTNLRNVIPKAQFNRNEMNILKNFNISKNSSNRDSGLIKEHRQGYSTVTASIISATTDKPFGFRIRGSSSYPTDLRASNVSKDERTIKRFPGQLATVTTARSFFRFDGSHPVKGDSRMPQTLDMIKINNENDKTITGNSAIPAEHDIKKVNFGKALIGVLFDDKRRNDEKIITGDNFRSSQAIIEKNGRFDFGNQEKINKFSESDRGLLFVDKANFPYSETLRSMQAETGISLQQTLLNENGHYLNSAETTTASSLRTAGTEFPVHSLTPSVYCLGSNESDDDTYYPKRSTSTETYFKLNYLNKNEKKSSRFSTKTPWPGSRNFEIPEVLPDLNNLDDLVDRRKVFYIDGAKIFQDGR